MDIRQIQDQLAKFAEDRDWEQFHSPKNLAMALAGEAAEIMEIFQWLTEEQSRNIAASEKQMKAVKEEIADVQIYLLRLADKLGVDVETAVVDKMKNNADKYPVELAKGNATKYSERES